MLRYIRSSCLHTQTGDRARCSQSTRFLHHHPLGTHRQSLLSTPMTTSPFTPAPPALYTFKLLRAASFKLDGGSMFGLIPRVVWSKTVPTDDKGRITVQHNCLLLDRVTPSSETPEISPRRVLIEVGSGDKLDPKMQEVFALERAPGTTRPRTIIDALAEVGATPESIDAVVVSHLHFDHAGALTRLPRSGERPTWAAPPNSDGGGGSSQAGGCCVTFPNASIHVQAREWHDAIANRSVMTKTYFPDHLHPIADRLKLVDSPRPFPFGFTPNRDDLPSTPIELRETELWPGGGLSVFLVPGHTWGQQAIKFTEPGPDLGGKGRTIVFTPDVMPTVNHSGAAYSLSYDVEPYTSMVTRRWFLAEAARSDWVLCLDHEPGHPLVRVKDNGNGWFTLVHEPE